MSSAKNSEKTEELQFPRGKAVPKQSPLFWVDQKNRYLRQLLLRDIEEMTGRELVVYFTDCSTTAQIDQNDEVYLAELLAGSKKKEVDLLLETNGGFTDPTEKVVSLLRNCGKDFRAIIPRRAKSNGTVIALASREIVMSDTSELGPIDPNIMVGPGQNVPAHFIVNTPPAQVAPIVRQLAEHAIKQTKKLAQGVLKAGMLSGKKDEEVTAVVEAIATRDVYHSHGSVIDHSEASRLGLNVAYRPMTDETWKRIWLLRCMYEQDCRSERLAKIFEGRALSSSIALPPPPPPAPAPAPGP